MVASTWAQKKAGGAHQAPVVATKARLRQIRKRVAEKKPGRVERIPAVQDGLYKGTVMNSDHRHLQLMAQHRAASIQAVAHHHLGPEVLCTTHSPPRSRPKPPQATLVAEHRSSANPAASVTVPVSTVSTECLKRCFPL